MIDQANIHEISIRGAKAATAGRIKSTALDLANTLIRRSDAMDEISTPARLEKWLENAGLLQPGGHAVNIGHMRQVKELRAAMFGCASAAIAGRTYPATDVETINRLAAQPGYRPRIEGGRLVLVAKKPRTAALASLAAEIVEILTMRREYLRACGGCGILFLEETGQGSAHLCS